ncbi:SH3 domain-containing protein [Porcincola sp. LCP21S3_C12]|uniref:SH3 domain-containing protein n=1 Tax=Porcincola sp. LCP21S3_C12 TaxID=3438798 RepID=UPI003F971051
MSKRSRAAYAGLSCVLFAAVMLSGCGKARIGGSTGSADSEKTAASSEQAKVVRVIIESETEAETTPETQKLITSVDYTSKDGTVKITLPDNTWKVTQDADEMRVFSSGNDAMINIVHASTEAAMKTLTVQTTKENLQAALLSQYSEASAFNIESYETKTVGSVNVYRYVVRYNADARMWAYAVTYGIVAPDQAYVITGTITDNNTTLLKAVEDSVYSFSVLKDEELKAVTDAMTGESETASAETKQTTAQTASPTASGENSTLSTYAQQTTMYLADSDVVNIRSGPGTDADIVGTLAAGGKVTVTGETSGWYQVSVNGVTGYIRKDFLTSTQTTTPSTTSAANSTSDSASAAEIASASNYSSASTLYTTDGVNVRANPGTGSGVLATLGAGSAVTVIGETDNWYIVSTGSGKGYISKSYLSSKAPAGSGASGSSSTGSTGSTGNGNGTSTGSSSGSTGSSGGGSGSGTQTSGVSTITGTVTSSSANSVTVAGDDGKTYTIYTGDADITTADGLYSGLHISASVDNSQTASDGTKYATSVTGE